MKWWIECVLVVLGGGLQVWGVLVTAKNLILAADASGGWLDVPRLLRRLVGVPRTPRVVDPDAADSATASDRGFAPVTWKKPPLDDNAAWIKFLDRRVEELDRDISNLGTKVHDLHDEQLTKMRALKADVEGLSRELHMEMLRATVEGSKISLRGVLHIVSGIGVAALAAPVAGFVAAVVRGLG